MIITNFLYLDASLVSGILVGVTGAVAVIGTPILIWWRKTKRKVAKTFHIDENAGKEVEEDLIINAEETEKEKTDASTTTESTDEQ